MTKMLHKFNKTHSCIISLTLPEHSSFFLNQMMQWRTGWWRHSRSISSCRQDFDYSSKSPPVCLSSWVKGQVNGQGWISCWVLAVSNVAGIFQTLQMLFHIANFLQNQMNEHCLLGAVRSFWNASLLPLNVIHAPKY